MNPTAGTSLIWFLCGSACLHLGAALNHSHVHRLAMGSRAGPMLHTQLLPGPRDPIPITVTEPAPKPPEPPPGDTGRKTPPTLLSVNSQRIMKASKSAAALAVAQPMDKLQADITEPQPEDVRHRVSLALQRRVAATFHYPPLARQRGWEGEVRVGLRVEADGRLSGIRLVKSSGFQLLDNEALRATAHIRRVPGETRWPKGNHLDMVLPVQFRLVEG